MANLEEKENKHLIRFRDGLGRSSSFSKAVTVKDYVVIARVLCLTTYLRIFIRSIDQTVTDNYGIIYFLAQLAY